MIFFLRLLSLFLFLFLLLCLSGSIFCKRFFVCLKWKKYLFNTINFCCAGIVSQINSITSFCEFLSSGVWLVSLLLCLFLHSHATVHLLFISRSVLIISFSILPVSFVFCFRVSSSFLLHHIVWAFLRLFNFFFYLGCFISGLNGLIFSSHNQTLGFLWISSCKKFQPFFLQLSCFSCSFPPF